METQNFILDDTRREVTLLFTDAELKPHYEKAYTSAQPHVQLPGFRKGKVPVSMIKQRFGKDLENEALETIASEGFQDFVKNENVNPIGRSTLRDIQREPDGSIRFTIGYEVIPEFELGNYRGLTIRKPVHEVTEEDVERELEELTLRYATTQEAEQITDELFIATVQFRTLDEASGMPILGGEPDEFTIFLKREPANSEVKAALLNAKVGDTFHHLMPDREDPNKSYKTLATVKSIVQVVPADISNDFVETATNSRFHTTEELREEYERQIKTYWEDTARRIMDDQIVEQILKAHDFAPPQSLVQEVITNVLKDEVERLPDKKLPKGFDIQRYVERLTPTATNTAKWMIIRERIIETEKLKVEDVDIDKHVDDLAEHLGTEANFEYLRSLVAGNEELQNRLMNDKVMETLRDYAVIIEVPDTEFASEFAEESLAA